MTVHACPLDGSGLTPCCRRPPFELPRTDHMTAASDAVTCTSPWRLLGVDPHAFAWAETVASHGTGPTATIDIDINVPGQDESVPVEIPLAHARTLHAMLGDLLAEHDEPGADLGLRETIAGALRAAAEACGPDCALPEEECVRVNPIREDATTFGVISDIHGPIDAIADAVLAVVQPELDRLTVSQQGASERQALLEEARDALEAAGENGAHGDDWPAIAPAIRALAGRVDADAKQLAEVDARCDTAEATIRRTQAECDRIETAVRANPTAPDFDGAYFAYLGRIRASLNGTDADQ